jgi:hypothetical protein
LSTTNLTTKLNTMHTTCHINLERRLDVGRRRDNRIPTVRPLSITLQTLQVQNRTCTFTIRCCYTAGGRPCFFVGSNTQPAIRYRRQRKDIRETIAICVARVWSPPMSRSARLLAASFLGVLAIIASYLRGIRGAASSKLPNRRPIPAHLDGVTA